MAGLNQKLTYQKDIRKGFICFTLVERGKIRKIMSVHFSERVVQKSLNQNALIPVLTRSLIHDNGASQKNKGSAFSIMRLSVQLRRHFEHHGPEGYILLIDIENFFGSLDHEICKGIVAAAFDDERIKWLFNLFIDAYYDYNVKQSGGKKDRKGLGLGSEVNQTTAVAYPNRIDHYVKEILRIKGYGRYMDDFYLIHESKEYLQYCLSKIEDMCGKLKLSISKKKTHIVKLSHGFTYLKTQFILTESGRIIKKPCRESVVRERRKLKKQRLLLDEGYLTFDDIRRSYASWRGGLVHKNARRTLFRMDALFNRLFLEEWRGGVENDGSNRRNADAVRDRGTEAAAGPERL